MALLFDITRSIARLTDPFQTGIGRTEWAVLDHTRDLEAPFFYIARISGRLYLFDRSGIEDAFSQLTERTGHTSLRFAWRIKLSKAQREVNSRFAECSLASARNFNARMAAAVSSEFCYLNLGHMNLDDAFLRDLKSSGCRKLSVFIHDLIPLDHPEFQTKPSVETFCALFQSVSSHADHVMVNSQFTKSRLEAHLEDGSNPSVSIHQLGVDTIPSKDANKNVVDHFLCVGTIEPRKNIGLLINLWEELAKSGEPPKLILAGRPGWNSSDILSKLVALSERTDWIEYHEDLEDAELRNLYRRARAVLMPSFVEGFGLPGLEAQALGIPLICSRIDVFQELYGGYAEFADPKNPTEWAKLVNENLASKNPRKSPIATATWQDFAKSILSSL